MIPIVKYSTPINKEEHHQLHMRTVDVIPTSDETFAI